MLLDMRQKNLTKAEHHSSPKEVNYLLTQYELADDLLSMSLTQNDIANMQIAENGTPTMVDIIEDLIESHDTSFMQQGVNYYFNRNDIKDRQIYYWKNGEKIVDETATNNRIPHGWHKLLVDQKANYLVGKPVTFNAKETSGKDEEQTDTERFVDFINDILGDQFNDDLWELTKNASNKGVEWLHPYINSDGEFNYAVIDGREVIPIWETSKQNKLQAVIRYYYMNVNGDERIRAEYWTQDRKEIYQENNQGVYQIIEEGPHFRYNNEAQSWGKVPFVAFKNNEEMFSDLINYKELIDDYDLNVSDLSNDLAELQEAIWVLKNYQGESLEEFQDNLRKYKALKTDGDGGAETITLDIPIKAKDSHLDRLEENIYTFGQGVNTKTDKFGNSPSGIALKFMYSLLDLKADKTERKFKRAIKKFLWFIAEYLRYKEKQEFNPDSVQTTFNKSMLINESEKIDSANKSKGVISDETLVANHPWVDDPQKEMDRLEEQENNADIFGDRIAQELGIEEGEI